MDGHGFNNYHGSYPPPPAGFNAPHYGYNMQSGSMPNVDPALAMAQQGMSYAQASMNQPRVNYNGHYTQNMPLFHAPHNNHNGELRGVEGRSSGNHEEAADEEEVQEVQPTQGNDVECTQDGLSHRGPGFQPDEDKVLCSGWLNVSKDAAIGTNQDKSSFYKRLHRYYLDNYDPTSNRTWKSIQKRWSLIQHKVSKFCAILSRIERLNQSGKSYHDMVNDAVKEYQRTEPWKMAHCWEVLREEPKWNDKVLEVSQTPQRQAKVDLGAEDTATQSDPEATSVPSRPEGRDAAKKRKASRMQENSDSSVAVDMLKRLNDRGQQMDEIESKQKEELISIERAKFELAQKQLQVKTDLMKEANDLTRELTEQKLRVQKEMKDAELKVQTRAIDVELIKIDTQIMFTDPAKYTGNMREWVLKRQMDIMIRDGIKPTDGEPSSST